MRISSAQFRKLSTVKKLSKENTERLEKWLDPIESEDSAQIRVVQYLEKLQKTWKVIKFTSIPNSTRTPYESVRVKNRLTGLRPWLCDLLIVYGEWDQYRTLWIEVKREKWWQVSKEQKEWIQVLKKCEWTTVHVAKWYDEAKQIIESVVFINK